MSGKQVSALMSVVVCVLLAAGCTTKESAGSGVITGPAGTYAGIWTGRVCGRGLTLTLDQSGLSLSGSYTLSDPVFGENVNGSVSGLTPPATATLFAGVNNRMEITFNSYNSLSGGFYKGSTYTCDVSATK